MKIIFLLFIAVLTSLAAPIYVTFDTSGLPVGTYYLDFQLNGGDATPSNNNVQLTGFDTAGGSFSGLTQLDGGATGSVIAGFDIVDSDPGGFNAVLQEFSPGATLRFLFNYSLNYSSGFPDQFSFAILNSAFTSIVSAGNGALLTIDLMPGATPVLLPADSAFGGATVSLQAIPEPSTTGLLVVAALGFWMVRNRQTR